MTTEQKYPAHANLKQTYENEAIKRTPFSVVSVGRKTLEQMVVEFDDLLSQLAVMREALSRAYQDLLNEGVDEDDVSMVKYYEIIAKQALREGGLE